VAGQTPSPSRTGSKADEAYHTRIRVNCTYVQGGINLFEDELGLVDCVRDGAGSSIEQARVPHQYNLCGGFEMKRLWQRFRDENKRMIAEVVQLQLEMDAKKALRSLPTFPKRPYKLPTIAIFSVFIFFLTIALLGLAKEVLNPLFR